MNDPVLLTSLPLLLQKVPSAWKAAAAKELTALLAISTDCKKALDAAKLDPNLSAQGRLAAAQGIARPALAKMAAWEEANPDAIEQRIRSTWEHVLGVVSRKIPTDVGDRIGYELRQQEIRNQLRPLDPQQRLVIYLGSTDPEVIAAIEDAPPTLTKDDPNDVPKLAPFIDPEQLRAAMVERARASDPDSAAEMQALGVLRDIYQSAVDAARNEILREFPSLEKDPLVAAAAGN